MRQRILSGNGNPPVSTLRRSPRFRQENQPKSECPKTLKCVLPKNRVPCSDLSPLSSVTDEDSLNKSQKLQSPQSSLSSKGSRKASSVSGKSTRLNGGAQGFPYVRKSARLSQNANAEKTGLSGSVKKLASDRPKKRCSSNGSKMVRVVNLRNRSLSVTEKRVNRSSRRDSNSGGGRDIMKGCNSLRKCSSIQDIGAVYKLDKGKSGGGATLSDQCLYKIEKRVTRSATRGIQDVPSSEFGAVKRLSDDGKAKLGANLSRDPISDDKNMTKYVPSADTAREEDRTKCFEAEKKQAGAKRKIQVAEEHIISDGWTRKQELALERAYFAAKPTPNFWKKVAKMVPGKSAQECFDKIHSELMTPPQHRRRSRAEATKSPLSLSASKLLNSSVPETKKVRYNKQKSHLAHKTVRQLLKKQCNVDQGNYADLFSVLEQTLDSPTAVVQDNRLLFTPERHTKEPGFDKARVERLSACRKHHSRLNNSCEAALTSPPVLKKIKNKALHEKYIDQLHYREAKRKAASLRTGKRIKGENGAKENNVQKMEAVRDAKNALVFCAKDAINQFQRLQSSKMNNFENTFDDFADSSDDES